MKTKEISRAGLLIALSMVLSYIESQIPAFVAIPGIKIGLANIVVVFALYSLNFPKACIISLVRVLLSAVLFGTVLSLAYSVAGAVLSLTGMALLKKTDRFSIVSVSVAGGVLHNLGQILVACLILQTNAVAYYIPFLLISGTLTGIATGAVSGIIIKRIGEKNL